MGAGVVGRPQFPSRLFDERAQADVWADSPKALDWFALCADRNSQTCRRRLPSVWLLALLQRLPPVRLDLPGPTCRTRPRCRPTHRRERWAALLLPKTDYEIVENWNVHGLRATGSHDIVVRDAFVPDHRILLFSKLQDGTAPA